MMGSSCTCAKPLILIVMLITSYFQIVATHEYGCSCSSPFPQPQPPPIFSDQRLAVVYPIIQNFKNTITTDPLNITQTWVGSNICKYKGFYCDHPPDNISALAVAAIDFNGFQLTAPTLDGFIDSLPDLAIFHANTNNFSGTISPAISNLPYFYELDVSNNRLSGLFPTTLLSISGLTFLDIRYNFFSGSVPPQIFTQPLDVLFINNNNFMQRLPYNLGSTTALFLTFANNKFTGPIPRSIGDASNTLIEVLFLNNKLTGCLPYELGFLRKATVIDAGKNFLTGPLPCSLGCLGKVEQLNFAGNLLYGQVPEAVCALGNLVNLSLSYNYFSWVGPICKKRIKSGVLDVRKNCIRGVRDQRTAAECAVFFRHARNCEYMASYNFIPCRIPPPYHRKHPRFPPRSNRHLISYAALSRHRL